MRFADFAPTWTDGIGLGVLLLAFAIQPFCGGHNQHEEPMPAAPTIEAVPCPLCNKPPTSDYDGYWSCFCRGCYDGPEDPIGVGSSAHSANEAVECWNERVEQYLEFSDEPTP